VKEFMLYIRNEKDAKKSLTEEQHLAFIKKCEYYINKLKSENKLIAAQPLIREGKVLKKSESGWIMEDISVHKEVHVGYYHIQASDLEEALKIAKENTEFEYVPFASIEVRLIKTKESETGFVYPNK
jgi:hypothetical protein